MRAAPILLPLAGSAVGLLVASEARAQQQPAAEAVIARVCAMRSEQAISETDIAEAMLTEAGIPPATLLAGITLPSSSAGQPLSEVYGALLIDRVRARRTEIPQNEREAALRSAINGGINNLEQYLNHEQTKVTIVRAADSRVTLFGGAQPTWTATCKSQEPPPPIIHTPAPPPRIAIRETAEELWLDDDGRTKAGAFALGFERTRSTLDDGTRKTETSFTIDGTIGLRLTPPQSPLGHVYLFATYNLERNRTQPPPTLGPGEAQSDGDTNALALGFDAHLQPRIGSIYADLNLQPSMVFDFANDARRIRTRAIFTPRFDSPNGLCGFGSFTAGPLRRRCVLSAEIEGAHILRRGTTKLGDYVNFLAAGVRGGIEFFLPTSPRDDTGLLAGVTYRFLAAIHGPRDIRRLDANLTHRFWTGADVGIDVGFTYQRGTNELTFEHEDKLTFGLGIVY
jgi:hypothetical protein